MVAPAADRLAPEARRRETPGASSVTHLNNAGAALPTERTLETVIAHLRREAEIGGYEAEDEAGPRLAAVRASAARLLRAEEDEVAITTSDTSGFVKAFWGFALAGGLAGGGRLVVDRFSYNSHYLAFLQAARAYGARVEIVPATADGVLDLDALARMVPGAALVSATFVPTSSGAISDVAGAGAIARRAGVPYFVDACQAVGQLPVDVEAIGCDVLTTTGRKWLRAPRGTGLLYVRRGFVGRCEPPGIDGTSASWTGAGSYEVAPTARRFEEFEASIAARLGLGAAIDQALALGLDAIAARIQDLAERLRALLTEAGARVLDGAGPRSGIVTFVVDGTEAGAIAARAAAHEVNVSVSRAPWARIDLAARGLEAVVRASPHVFNDEADLDRLVAVVRPKG